MPASSCLQIFGRKIQNLIKFNSLIAKHFSETIHKSNDAGLFALQRNVSDLGILLAHTSIACSNRMSCTCREAAGSKSVEDCKRSWNAGNHLSSV